MKVIKVFQNNKIYDTEMSCYMTLKDINDLVIKDTPFMVINNKSKVDITQKILKEIIFLQEKTKNISIDILKEKIRSNSNLD